LLMADTASCSGVLLQVSPYNPNFPDGL
jgi:hypothetical protein